MGINTSHNVLERLKLLRFIGIEIIIIIIFNQIVTIAVDVTVDVNCCRTGSLKKDLFLQL